MNDDYDRGFIQGALFIAIFVIGLLIVNNVIWKEFNMWILVLILGILVLRLCYLIG